MDPQRVMAAIAEPTRFRIVQLLVSAPRTVGEIGHELGALQPQTTKHVQALESAGVVTVHRLGRRRVVSLRRDALDELAASLSGMAAAIAEEPALTLYERAIASEGARAAAGDDGGRILRFERVIAARPADVWRAWTRPDLVRRWWAPDHFEVVDCEIGDTPGTAIRIVLAEGDGAQYVAVGRVLAAEPALDLRFDLAPVDEAGHPLFSGEYRLTLAGDVDTRLELEIKVSDVRPDAAPAVAGLEFGWPQLLDRLESLVRSDGVDPT